MNNAIISIQNELKAPKGQFNSFGRYKYRSCEDILEAVKPLLHKYSCSLNISDEVVMVGDRFYIKATATLRKDTGEVISSSVAYAREDEAKKGMDGAQVTGAASSYARKYALNGLFCIDDTKDADTDEYTKKANSVSTSKPAEQEPNEAPPAPKPKVIKVNGNTKLLTNAGYVSLKTIDKEKLQKMYDSGYYAEANTEIEKVLDMLSKSDQEVLDNI